MTEKEIIIRNREFFLTELVGEDLYQFAYKNIGIDYALALEGEISPYISKLISRSHYFYNQIGKRTEIEILRELVYSRIVENVLMREYPTMELSGTDSENLITNVSNYFPDFRSSIDGTLYEVISSYTYYKEYNHQFIRKGKMDYLMKLSANKRVYLIFVDVNFKRMMLIKVEPSIKKMDVDVVETEQGYTINLPYSKWFPIYRAENPFLPNEEYPLYEVAEICEKYYEIQRKKYTVPSCGIDLQDAFAYTE